MPRVLIVDDSKTIRIGIRNMLESFDFEHDEAENGKDCIEKVSSGSYDAVLLDWNMPVMNGLECLKRLRASGCNKRLRVLIVTTESGFENISEALEEGADEYIIKPFDKCILQEKLAIVGISAKSRAVEGN